MNQIYAVCFVIIILAAYLTLWSLALWLLLGRKISFAYSWRISCALICLNKLIFTAVGYAGAIYKLRKAGISPQESLPAFSLLELLTVTPWLIAGFVSGAGLARHFPLLFLLVLSACCLVFLIKRKTLSMFLKGSFLYLKNISLPRFCLVSSLCLGTALLMCGYYLVLAGSFGWELGSLPLLKTVWISFTAGYLSPLPSGIGARESAQALLLLPLGVHPAWGVIFALGDRITQVLFYLSMGLLFSRKLVMEELLKPFTTPKTAVSKDDFS